MGGEYEFKFHPRNLLLSIKRILSLYEFVFIDAIKDVFYVYRACFGTFPWSYAHGPWSIVI
jgi:hypothetical protein